MGRIWARGASLSEQRARRDRLGRDAAAALPPPDGAPCEGAYWDTEVKRAQERGLPLSGVTRKAMTDLSPTWPA